MDLIKNLKQQFVVPVIREKDAQQLESICYALMQGGLSLIEIALMSEAAFNVIEKLSKHVIVGAGTVLNGNAAKKAIEAGAQFIVSPGFNTHTFEVTTQHQILYIPGVLTPSEIMQAKSLGLHLLKLFPIKCVGGPHYLRALEGPFSDIQWMASGGIGINDVQDYMLDNVVCVGVGEELIPKEMMKNKDWKSLSQLVESMINQIAKGKDA